MSTPHSFEDTIVASDGSTILVVGARIPGKVGLVIRDPAGHQTDGLLLEPRAAAHLAEAVTLATEGDPDA